MSKVFREPTGLIQEMFVVVIDRKSVLRMHKRQNAEFLIWEYWRKCHCGQGQLIAA